jgi:translation initiation factor eIF-2B subunit delta
MKVLLEEGVDCIYTLLSHVSYFMKKVNKVFVGASAMLTNGALVSRIGTALVIN